MTASVFMIIYVLASGYEYVVPFPSKGEKLALSPKARSQIKLDVIIPYMLKQFDETKIISGHRNVPI